MLTSLIILVFLPTVCPETDLSNTTEDFQLKPANETFYFNSPKTLTQFCIPPIGYSHVTWRKNNEELTNSQSLHIFHSHDIGQFVKNKQFSNTSSVFILKINPVVSSDQGVYTCVANNSAEIKETKFQVIVIDDCDVRSFKCVNDDICILKSTVCDGIQNCYSDAYDESLEAGCHLPEAPKHLLCDRKTWNHITINWNFVKNAIRYELLVIYQNNKTKIIETSSDIAVVNLDNLPDDTTYQFMVRAESVTGFSGYSSVLKVKTDAYKIPPIPSHFSSKSISPHAIIMKWRRVTDASSYEVVIVFPDDTEMSTLCFPNLLEATFNRLTQNTSYLFKIRARSSYGYGGFSGLHKVKTLTIGQPDAPVNVRVLVVKQSVLISWMHTSIVANSQLYHLHYGVSYCELIPYFKTILYNTTALKHVMIDQPIFHKNITINLPLLQVMTNKSHNISKIDTLFKKVLVQKVVTVQKSRKMLHHRKRHCIISQRFRNTSMIIKHLKPLTTYWFKVTTFGLTGVEGKYSEGNFTTEMSTTGPGPLLHSHFPKEEFSGIIVFGIVTGGLIAILIISFVLAYTCKWKVLMDAMDEYKLSQMINNNSPNNENKDPKQTLLNQV